ncbi:MAG: DUF3135 domain-containing protein [Gammaproteobacteria bacterium]|nr:DUF3135 domain-containing protein [Gammaproteobacteria bacterium]
MTIQSQLFDFERWSQLAKTDPEGFEALRRQEVAAFIQGVPDARQRQRLERLQWRIDRERERTKNPLMSCIRIYNMMWESLFKHQQALVELAEGRPQHTTPPPANARVLSFERKEQSVL